MTRISLAKSFALLAIVSLGLSSTALAQGSVSSKISGEITALHMQMKLESDPAAIVGLREDIFKLFIAKKSSSYRKNAFKAIYKQFGPMIENQPKAFSANDEFAANKRLNIVMAICKMRTSAAIGVLQKLAGDNDPAIRAQAWIGLHRNIYYIFKASKTKREAFMKMLANAMKTEKAPGVLRQIFRFADLGSNNTYTKKISSGQRKTAATAFFKMLQNNWKAYRLILRAKGDATSAAAMSEAVKTQASLAKYLGSTPTIAKASLQMSLDMGASATIVMGEIWADWETEAKNPLVVASLKQLILDCEASLQTVSGIRFSPAATAVKKSAVNMTAAPDNIYTSLTNWLDKLAKFKVTEPEELELPKAK